ncbi:MAG TPA: NAD(P)/FAD-dependent oxidoreductase [Vicinamibacterales bacterium]|nr:NAD(P)/FAD-dependent oxidoreductase [Vicinamibacterales bacterium]
MDTFTTCDALIVGGGPAGSTCARALVDAGLNVIVLDRCRFPRDKVCAGWITPQVVEEIELDLEDYTKRGRSDRGGGRTLQPITGFRTGIISDSQPSRDCQEIRYHRVVSYGIRRCEFDDYLLRRSGATLQLGQAASGIKRHGTGWIVNDTFAASLLVGAGGHFCPVAALLNPSRPQARSLVVAQEAEFELDPSETRVFAGDPEVPELYFCPDMKGYGWCFRKGGHVNVGLGRLDRESLPKATTDFVRFLEQTGRVPGGRSYRWKGHAYLVNAEPRRRLVDDGVMLIGDAAGLAYPQSGEGIRPAVESGMLAAHTVLAAAGKYDAASLAPFGDALRTRFAPHPLVDRLSALIPSFVVPPLAELLLGNAAFVRHVALDRWFLHARQASLPPR